MSYKHLLCNCLYIDIYIQRERKTFTYVRVSVSAYHPCVCNDTVFVAIEVIIIMQLYNSLYNLPHLHNNMTLKYGDTSRFLTYNIKMHFYVLCLFVVFFCVILFLLLIPKCLGFQLELNYEDFIHTILYFYNYNEVILVQVKRHISCFTKMFCVFPSVHLFNRKHSNIYSLF